MGQVGKKLRAVSGGFSHWCPACQEMHTFKTTGPLAPWKFDGNADAPTFAPSMNITVNAKDAKGHDPDEPTEICHYFLVDGVIQYLADCTHGLRNRRVDLPDLPEALMDSRPPPVDSVRDVET